MEKAFKWLCIQALSTRSETAILFVRKSGTLRVREPFFLTKSQIWKTTPQHLILLASLHL